MTACKFNHGEDAISKFDVLRDLSSVNNVIWDIIETSPDNSFDLSCIKDRNIDESVALSVLGILQAAELIEMQIYKDGVDAKAEFIEKLTAWHRDKTLSYEDFKAWALQVLVRWIPTEQAIKK